VNGRNESDRRAATSASKRGSVVNDQIKVGNKRNRAGKTPNKAGNKPGRAANA